MTRIDAVLFDWGDTLFESPHAPREIVAHAKARDLSRDAHRRVWTELFSRKENVIPGIGRVLYEKVMEPRVWGVYPDSEPTLRALRERGVKIGIVSNHAYDLREFFRATKLEKYIDAYAISYEIGVAKPAPRIFEEACRRLGVAPANTLMVGDDAVSDGGAADAGLQVYLLGPYTRGGPRGLGRVVEIVDASRAVRS